MKLPPGHGTTTEHSYGGFGAKMLAKLGWSSGKGLGKNEDGMADALAPKRRDDGAGIGGTQRYPWQEKLWEKSFEAAMKRLPLAVGVPGDTSDSGGDDSDSDSDGEAAPKDGDVAQAEARRGRAAGASSSSSDGDADEVLRHGEAVGRDGIFVSGTRAELALARELAKDPWGRFGGRQGKMARIAAAEAAAAVAAGRAPPPKPPAAADPEADAVHAARRREERDKRKAEKVAAAKAAKAAAKASKAEAASRKRARSASPPPPPLRIIEAADGAADAAPAPAPAQHWWSRLFHSAGAMLGAEHTARKERGFCEADQEALFMDAHGGKTEGRVGLGRRSDANPLKIGGARWAGSKVAFADADAEGDEQAEEAQEAGEDGGDHAAAAGALKWRKLAAATLAAAPKGALKEKKLRKAVLAAAAAKLGWHGEAEGAPPDGGSRALKAAFQAADPLSSSRFARLPCGRVALADAEKEAGEEAPPRSKKSKKQRS